MTENRAILQIKYRVDTATNLVGVGIDGKAYEDLELAIKALEKQIPKKVNNYDKGCDTYGDCPMCGQSYTFGMSNRFNYCHNCGQKLDWN